MVGHFRPSFLWRDATASELKRFFTIWASTCFSLSERFCVRMKVFLLSLQQQKVRRADGCRCPAGAVPPRGGWGPASPGAPGEGGAQVEEEAPQQAEEAAPSAVQRPLGTDGGEVRPAWTCSPTPNNWTEPANNSKTAPMGVYTSAGDLLTMRKLKNTYATSNLHIDQCNILSAAQINVVANKEMKKPQYDRRPKNEGLLYVLIELVLRES